MPSNPTACSSCPTARSTTGRRTIWTWSRWPDASALELLEPRRQLPLHGGVGRAPCDVLQLVGVGGTDAAHEVVQLPLAGLELDVEVAHRPHGRPRWHRPR